MARDRQCEVIFGDCSSSDSLNEVTSLPLSSSFSLSAASFRSSSAFRYCQSYFVSSSSSWVLELSGIVRVIFVILLLITCGCDETLWTIWSITYLHVICYLLLCLLRTIITHRKCLEFWRLRLAFHCARIYTLIYTPQDQQATDCTSTVSLPIFGMPPITAEFPRLAQILCSHCIYDEWKVKLSL
jgi:hypothetical protein